MAEEPQPYPVDQPVMMGHTTEGALQYQLEGISTVERVEHIIMGEVQVKDPKTFTNNWKKIHTPMLNSEGINMIRGYLTMYLGGTKTYALSDIERDYIGDEVIDIGKNIKAELMDNWSEYDVKDYAAATFIINIVCSAVYAVLKKGENATYLKFLRTTQNIQEVQHHQSFQQQFKPEQNDGGVMNFIFGRKKKR